MPQRRGLGLSLRHLRQLNQVVSLNLDYLYQVIFRRWLIVHLDGSPSWFTARVYSHGSPSGFTFMVHSQGSPSGFIPRVHIQRSLPGLCRQVESAPAHRHKPIDQLRLRMGCSLRIFSEVNHGAAHSSPSPRPPFSMHLGPNRHCRRLHPPGPLTCGWSRRPVPGQLTRGEVHREPAVVEAEGKWAGD